MGWVILIGFALLLQGIAKFIDDYHAQKSHKEKITRLLIRAFIWLDNTRIPDIPDMLLVNILHTKAAIRLSYILKVFAACFVIMFSYIALTGLFIKLSNLSSVVFPIFLAFTLSCVTTAVIVCPVRLVFKQGEKYEGRLLGNLIKLFSITLLPIFLVAFWGLIGLASFNIFAAPESNPMHNRMAISLAATMFIIAFIPTLPFFLFPIVMIFLTIAKITIEMIRKFLLVVFDGATSPNISPYSYLAALTGIFILLAKFVRELF